MAAIFVVAQNPRLVARITWPYGTSKQASAMFGLRLCIKHQSVSLDIQTQRSRFNKRHEQSFVKTDFEVSRERVAWKGHYGHLRPLMWVSRNPFFTQHTKGGLRYRALGPFYDLSSSMGPFNSPSAMKYAGWGKTSGLILKVFFSWQYPYIMSIYKIITNRKMLWSFIKFTPLVLGA